MGEEEVMEKILFIDDRKRPEMYFGFGGVEVTWAKNCKEALRLWKDGDFNTVYLDNDLGPGIQGYQLLRKMIDIREPKKVYSITNNFVARKCIRGVCNDFDIEFEVGLTIFEKIDKGLI